MYKIILSICLILTTSCEDQAPCYTGKTINQVPLYLDMSCRPSDVELIKKAVTRLNKLADKNICNEIIEIIGYDLVNHNQEELVGGKIACYYYKPIWFDINLKGSARPFENVRLYFFKEDMNKKYRLSLMMHELMHYVGVRGHTENKKDIMYTSGPNKTKYTQGDLAHFCSFYTCP